MAGTRVRQPPPREITAQVVGNAHAMVLPVRENTPLCPNHPAFTVYLCRVTQGCPEKPAIPLADTACSDITPHHLKLYPKRGSFESRTLVALQVRIIWPFPPSCEPHQLRKVVEVPLDEKERRIWGRRVLSQEVTRVRFWQGRPWRGRERGNGASSGPPGSPPCTDRQTALGGRAEPRRVPTTLPRPRALPVGTAVQTLSKE